MSVIELFVEFEQLPNTIEEPHLDFDWQSYNSKSKEEYEGNYNFMRNKQNAPLSQMWRMWLLASEHQFREPSFMCALDLDAMNEPEFPEYANADPTVVTDSEFVI
ncbi:hypothetical protein Ahy_A07g036914 isoform B [Arachis hypogaea]|uniref:Aminotransferase-like plant mobile domain-containing protein n=1 Tax=Arachis hypogaea TaxID=3818 RepID=A0A445CHC7_ARAHY|nr:hypothetical protein Ahy_A07g036914 isoform B [Arachis hypogaea]